MESRERYFDNAATTPLDPRVLDEMMPFLTNGFGNSASLHTHGQRAKAAVELARQRVASLVGAEAPEQIVFGSGATESCNWVLANFDQGVISPFEHSAVRETALTKGFGILENDGTTLVSVMAVNNEVGTLLDPRGLAPYGCPLHTDATQALGKLPLNLEGIAYASFSAHKLYGPKGIGATYFAEEPPTPLLLGGEGESGLRAGTLNVPGIVGFGAACALAEERMEEDLTHAQSLRATVLDALQATTDWQVNGGEHVSPYILSLSFFGIEGETLVLELDARGFAISAGAACSSRSTEPSHVLQALGLPEAWRRGTIRISFGRDNTESSASDLARNLTLSVEKIRTMSRMDGSVQRTEGSNPSK